MDLLPRSLRIIQEMGSEFSLHTTRLEDLEIRLAEGRFHLAVLGQFKRGKSTLLNAILGEQVLPSSVIPVTAIPTFIYYGGNKEVVIHFQIDRPDERYVSEKGEELNRFLLTYVSEEKNPQNREKVAYAEVWYPAPLLKEVVLIDTPGIGSTHRHNTELTLQFLTQCDAALFLVSSDPPITEVEVEFLQQVKVKVAKLFLLLNKVDYLDDTERVTALGFLRGVLERSIGWGPDAEIFFVSARQGLQARRMGDATLWRTSGLSTVIDHLVRFLADEKLAVLHIALAKKAEDILEDVPLQVQLELRSLEMPLADVEQRLRIFEEKIQEAEQQRTHARDILAGDQRRAIERLESLAGTLRNESRGYFLRMVDSILAEGGTEQAAQEKVASAIPEYYNRNLGDVSVTIDQEVTHLLREHERRAEALIESIRSTAAALFEIPYHAAESERAFVLQRKPFWVAEKGWSSVFNPIPNDIIDHVLPRSIRERRIRDRLGKQIEYLVLRNVENLRWDTLQNLNAAFLHFGTVLDEDLRTTVDATYGAITAAVKRRQAQENAVTGDLVRLRSAYAAVTELRDQLKDR